MLMNLIDWTGEYNIPRDDIRGDLFYRHMDDAANRLDKERPELYALYARVTYCEPMGILEPTSVMITAGLTLGQVETEIRLTTSESARTWPEEVVDYRDIPFWGEKNLGLIPGESLLQCLARAHTPEFFGISFR